MLEWAHSGVSENCMRIDAIAIGHNPPDDVNVIIEVPIGGEPIKLPRRMTRGAINARMARRPALRKELA